MELTLGVDIGTYESKGVLVDLSGTVVASAVRAHHLSVPGPGLAEHDAEKDWWGDFTALTRELLKHPSVEDPRQVVGVGVSGIGPCVLPIDAQGTPLRPAILYGIDTRASEEITLIEEAFGREEIYRRCGNTLSSQSAGPKLAWLARHEPEIAAATHKFVTSQSFLVGRLTGRWIIDHGTAGYFHPLYSLEHSKWNDDWCDGIVERAKLPELGWATDVAGTVSAEAAATTGLAEGTPVAVGTTDSPAEAVSAGVTDAGRTMVMYGSTMYILEMLDKPVQSEDLWSAPYVFPHSYVLAGGTATSGTLTRWFQSLITTGETAPDFEAMAAEAAMSPPGARGLISLPHFSGERTPLNDSSARGAVIGLDLTHTRSDVYRSLLEGIALGVKSNLDAFAEAGARPTDLRAVGGGTKNPVWTQAVSDAVGREQSLFTGVGASLGDAGIAALAVGAISRKELAARPHSAGDVHPRKEYRELYDNQHRRATALYLALKGVGSSRPGEP